MIYTTGGSDFLVGGIGGVIVGQELRAGPFTIAANLWTGIGGVATSPRCPEGGYGVLFGELNLEAGIAVTRWMQVVAYGGMQAIANIAPGTRPGGDLFVYSPVAGIRLAWGSF